MSDLTIEIRGLSKSYKDVNALKGVDVLIKKVRKCIVTFTHFFFLIQNLF